MSPTRPRGSAATAAHSSDPELRGRTYAIPFDTVWEASLRLAGGGLRRWTVLEADDQVGFIKAETRALIGGSEHDIHISITLDQDAQTRVDATAQARKPDWDLGAARRRLRRFFGALDRALAGARTGRSHAGRGP